MVRSGEFGVQLLGIKIFDRGRNAVPRNYLPFATRYSLPFWLGRSLAPKFPLVKEKRMVASPLVSDGRLTAQTVSSGKG
jgi:hypothetical protein